MKKGNLELPDVSELAELYHEAVKQQHVARAQFLKESMQNVARAEAAAVEAMVLRSFSDSLA
ncbi:hypothetical protein [Roseobacter weihaiensis]|uniref:hypothetical protein n=1 Tax=Roseobacter weihaiensis TaxID=2763262 RepID=UPI001D09FB04|nr:hypothetical protein [Roseobacter sp. H9]